MVKTKSTCSLFQMMGWYVRQFGEGAPYIPVRGLVKEILLLSERKGRAGTCWLLIHWSLSEQLQRAHSLPIAQRNEVRREETRLGCPMSQPNPELPSLPGLTAEPAFSCRTSSLTASCRHSGSFRCSNPVQNGSPHASPMALKSSFSPLERSPLLALRSGVWW